MFFGFFATASERLFVVQKSLSIHVLRGAVDLLNRRRAQGNLRREDCVCLRSYRDSLAQYLIAKFFRERGRRQDVYGHSEQFLDLELNTGNVQKRGNPANRVNQKIDVAAFPVRAVQHRPENTRIPRIVGFNDATNLLLVRIQQFRWSDVAAMAIEVGVVGMGPVSLCSRRWSKNSKSEAGSRKD